MLKKLFKKKTYTYNLVYITANGTITAKMLRGCKHKDGMRESELAFARNSVCQEQGIDSDEVVLLNYVLVVED